MGADECIFDPLEVRFHTSSMDPDTVDDPPEERQYSLTLKWSLDIF